jgi:uncharacterized protein YggL (DUF469 family)
MSQSEAYTIDVTFVRDEMTDEELEEFVRELEQVNGVEIDDEQYETEFVALSEPAQSVSLVAATLVVNSLQLLVALYKLSKSCPENHSVWIKNQNGDEVNVWDVDHLELYNIEEDDDRVLAEVNDDEIELNGLSVQGDLNIDGDLKVVNTEDTSMFEDDGGE